MKAKTKAAKAKDAENEHADQRRKLKVAALVSYALGAQVSADNLRSYSTAQRDAFAAAVGIRPPSDQTWQAVVTLVGSMERQVPSNPFDRFPKGAP